MKTSSILKSIFISGTILAVSPAMAGDSLESMLTDGNFFGEARYRYEFVDQDGIAKDANASTMRVNLGFKTGEYKNFQALVEGQLVRNIGSDDFNDSVNNKTEFPTVADPDVEEINELWVSYNGLANTSVKVGRQKVNIDNQRFVGTVGWRQNDQTFDAFSISHSGIQNLDLLYSYIGNVNRIQGDDHTLGDLDTKTHVAHATYAAADWMDITAYGYWLDIERLAARSSKTYGVRLTGDLPVNQDWTFFYEVEAASQSEHGNNTTNYSENYYHVAPGIKGHGFSAKIGYEELGGNGTSAFQTPLATSHKFNGWADKFLNTPASGLEDTYLSASYKVSKTDSVLDGAKLTATYHDFEGDSGGNYGTELDLSVGKAFTLSNTGPIEKVKVLLKYADYEAEDASYTDTQKVWLQVGASF